MRYSIPRHLAAVTLMCTSAATLVAAQVRSSNSAGDTRLTGKIADSFGAAIPKAEIVVSNTTFRAQSGDDGRFELAGIPAGQIEVVVRRLGFAPAKIPLQMDSGELKDIRVLLAPVATQIDSVAVVADAPAVEKAFGGFEMRKSRGFGTFITRDQIAKKNPRVTTDLFRTVSGVKLLRENGTPTVVSTRLGTMAYCPVRYFLDGASLPLYGQSIDTMVQPADIGAIEIYPGGATVPPQFGGRESACGVVAIWTRQGTKAEKKKG